jgi:uncharacterized protein YdeI (YjbR/CyaY-like superfamily)
MNAAFTLDLASDVQHTPYSQKLVRAPAPAVSIPVELTALFEESAKMKASFWRLDDRERRGFVRYIEEATTPHTRERRAAIIAMSLMGLARDMKDEPRG